MTKAGLCNVLLKCQQPSTERSELPSFVKWFFDNSIVDDVLNISDKDGLLQVNIILHLNVLYVDWIQLHVDCVQVKVFLNNVQIVSLRSPLV